MDTNDKVEKAIQLLQCGQSYDHVGLQDDHLIYWAHTLVPILALMFNRVLLEGHANTWMHRIVPIYKSTDSLQPGSII